MDIKEAEKIWSGESTCFRIFDIIECARTIVEDRENQITARDRRIAELVEDFRTMQDKASDYRLTSAKTEKECNQRIADLYRELEKTRSNLADKIRQFCSVIDERDEARRDAYEIASLLKTSAEQLCLERGGVVNEYGAYNVAVQMLNKYGAK